MRWLDTRKKTVELSLETLHMYCTEEGECLLWNLGTNGQGLPIANIDGGAKSVRRYIFTELMGMDATGLRVIAKCGNPLCVAPRCARGITFSRSVSDSYKSGKRIPEIEAERGRRSAINRGWAKIDADKARQICSQKGSKTAAVLGEEYGLKPDTIYRIWSGRNWPQLSPWSQLLKAAA